MDDILRLNLLGKRFDIPHRIVVDYPQTLLGNTSLLSTYYRSDRNDYYFERNSFLFPYILTYYTLERKIFCPHNVPVELLKNECHFFQLNNPSIYHEINKIETYQYFQRRRSLRKDFFTDTVPFITGLLFMIVIGLETSNAALSNTSYSLSYFVELFSTLLLSSTILYQAIYKKDFSRKRYFLLNIFSSVLSIVIFASQNLVEMTNHRMIHSSIMLLKTFRLFLVIAHLRILRLILITFMQRLQTICILVFINVIIIGSLSEITFAFERRQSKEKTDQSTMKTHLDAFWWATSLSFTIGFGHTDPHSTLTTVGRFCSYMLTFFGLFFNGLILQELIKGFLKVYRRERREQ